MSTAKKSVKKPAPEKKPAPAKKSAPAKKPTPAKKPAPAKKPVPAKKSEPVKKPAPVKKAAPAKKPAPVKKPAAEKNVSAVAVKPDSANRKVLPMPRKTPKAQPVKKVEPMVAFENNSQDLAFNFAERMKQMHREDDRSASPASEIKLPRRPTSRAKGAEVLQFSAEDLAEFRKRLILLRQEALGQSTTLRTIALEQTDDRGGEDEDGSDAFMRLQNLNQVDSQNKIIQKIDEALHRIADGSYGICEVCGQLIRKPRLLNLPFVHTCMECQTAMENPYGSH